MKKKYNLFLILTLFFTGVIFLINTYFFSDNLIQNLEEQYIEETLKVSKKNEYYIKTAKNIILENKKAKIKEEKINKILEKNKYKNIKFSSVPYEFLKENGKEKKEIELILKNNSIFSLLKKIEVIFYDKKLEVRWKMKNKTVKIFSPNTMKEDELIAIFIHEFAHYIDIYSLEKKEFSDISNNFYTISWYSTKVINSWLTKNDFVSGYAMTNKYEDFAESLTYYILHNNDFLYKTKNSIILKRKYNFFSFYIFSNWLFQNTDFSKKNKIKNYYRDITKISFSLNNFLQYLKKSI